MKKLLVVVDMQKDFVDGALANPMAQKLIPAMKEYLENWKDDMIFTRDTHTEDYLSTQEGRKLPVVHCVRGTAGWQVVEELRGFAEAIEKKGGRAYLDKPVFGSEELGVLVRENAYEEVTLIGVCTGICVINNAMIVRTMNPETEVRVVEDLCACVTEETHRTALEAMKTFQVEIV